MAKFYVYASVVEKTRYTVEADRLEDVIENFWSGCHIAHYIGSGDIEIDEIEPIPEPDTPE